MTVARTTLGESAARHAVPQGCGEQRRRESDATPRQTLREQVTTAFEQAEQAVPVPQRLALADHRTALRVHARF
ncbi:MAG: hypothetical protein L0Z62_00525 [Gemmataceae bacterium]|nr:hypothetical protein [Gemmataceae bacterium]